MWKTYEVCTMDHFREKNCNVENDSESQRAESCHLKVRKSRCYNDEYCRSDPNTVQKM